MTINERIQQLLNEEKVDFVYLWDCVVAKGDTHMRDGLHLILKLPCVRCGLLGDSWCRSRTKLAWPKYAH